MAIQSWRRASGSRSVSAWGRTTSWAPQSWCSCRWMNKLSLYFSPRCIAALIVCWYEQSPFQYIDFWVQHYLVVFWTIQLLSNIREDFLNVSSIGDLEIVVVQLHLCKLILFFTPRFPGPWTLIHLSPRSLGTRKRIVISVRHLRTWRWAFASVSPWFLSDCEIRIPTQSASPQAVWGTRIQHGRLIRAQNFFISNSLASISPPQALLLSFFPELSSTWCSVFLQESKWLQENIEKFMLLNKRRRWLHSSRVKNLQSTYQRVGFLVPTYLIWIWEVQIDPIKHNPTQLCWSRTNMSYRRTTSLYDHFDHSFIVFKNVQLSFELRRFYACDPH